MEVLQDRIMTVEKLLATLHSTLSSRPDWADVPVCLVDVDGVTPLPVSTEVALMAESSTGRPIVMMLRLSANQSAVDHVKRMAKIARLDSHFVKNTVRERFDD